MSEAIAIRVLLIEDDEDEGEDVTRMIPGSTLNDTGMVSLMFGKASESRMFRHCSPGTSLALAGCTHSMRGPALPDNTYGRRNT